MKHLISLGAGLLCLAAVNSSAYASDWDVVGKILTGIEGTRILTAGKVDVIGSITGIKPANQSQVVYKSRYNDSSSYSHSPRQRRIWVPDYTWKKKWVPRHTEFDEKLGEITIAGHYISYKVEAGGHWEYTGRDKDYSRFH